MTATRTVPVATMKRKQTVITARLVLLCCWCLLLLTAACSGLPITSKPLDNNPDHLTWEAAWLSEDSRAPQPLSGKSKKITPKSIFITPYLNNYNASFCPPDYKVDHNGKCIQIVSINTADILVTKLQSLFSQHGDNGSPGGAGEVDYDYDYDATGPFQVNLPLSIDLAPEPPQPYVPQGGPKLTYQDIPGPSFYDSAMVDVATVEQDNGKITTVSVGTSGGASEKPFRAAAATTTVATSGNGKESTTTTAATSTAGTDQAAAESHTDISFLAFETLPNGTLAGQIELDGNNRTVVQSILVSSTTTPSTERATSTDGSTKELTASTELDSRSGTTTDRASESTNTDATVASSSPLSSTPDMTVTSTTVAQGESTTPTTERQDEVDSTVDTSEKNVDASSTITTGAVATTTVSSSTTEQDENLDDLKLDLVDELLLLDNNRSTISSTPPADASTTDDVAEMDLDTLPTSETQPADELPTVAGHREASSTMKIVFHTIPPTKAPVQIITPLRNSWWEYGNRGGGSLAPASLVSASSVIQQDRTTRSTPETTTVPYDRRASSEKPHQTVERNEMEHVLDELKAPTVKGVNDAGNRFVYHPLPTEATPDRDILQVRPIATTPATNNHHYLEQLRKINEIVAEKRRQQQQQEQQLAATGTSGDGSTGSTRIRFPSHNDEQLAGAASSNHYHQHTAGASGVGGGVRFPGSATNRLTANGNRLPDIFPKKSPDSTTQRPAFWWLPSGWEVDQTGNKPMLLRFWSRMPLVRDASQQGSAGNGVNENELSTGNAGPNNNRWRSSTGFESGNSLPTGAATGIGSSRASSASSSTHPVASARGNSKSPSENFYKEVSAQEVYKVMNARQLNHHQQKR